MGMSNATLANTLEQVHHALEEELDRLERAAHAPTEVMPLELRNRLEMVRTSLAEHFRSEEQGDYLGEVRQREPRLEREAQHLLEDHRRLMHSLDALVREAANPEHNLSSLRDKVLHWLEQMREHEAHENRFVGDAFNLDVGAED